MSRPSGRRHIRPGDREYSWNPVRHTRERMGLDLYRMSKRLEISISEVVRCEALATWPKDLRVCRRLYDLARAFRVKR